MEAGRHGGTSHGNLSSYPPRALRPVGYTSKMAGLLTSRVLAWLTFPGNSQWYIQPCSPLTVAGAVTELAPIGSSSPCSLFIPHGLWRNGNHRGQVTVRLLNCQSPSCGLCYAKDKGRPEGRPFFCACKLGCSSCKTGFAVFVALEEHVIEHRRGNQGQD